MQTTLPACLSDDEDEAEAMVAMVRRSPNMMLLQCTQCDRGLRFFFFFFFSFSAAGLLYIAPVPRAEGREQVRRVKVLGSRELPGDGSELRLWRPGRVLAEAA